MVKLGNKKKLRKQHSDPGKKHKVPEKKSDAVTSRLLNTDSTVEESKSVKPPKDRGAPKAKADRTHSRPSEAATSLASTSIASASASASASSSGSASPAPARSPAPTRPPASASAPVPARPPVPASSTLFQKAKLSPLQLKFAKKLEGSRFRVINEQLYTSSGADALSEFSEKPELFEAYHQGFRSQVESWPENPLDEIIAWLKKKYTGKVVADMGCGDARLSATLHKTHKVHAFDLVSHNSFVTAADIANVPLPPNSVDVVVFCLSLMGTNIGDFISEANRILKVGGALKIVEVRSRFEKEADGVKKFIRTVKKAGFEPHETVGAGKPLQNKMFFELECVKVADIKHGRSDKIQYTAGACLYKRR